MSGEDGPEATLEPPEENMASDEDGMGPKSPVRSSMRSLLKARRDSATGGGALSARNSTAGAQSQSPIAAEKKKPRARSAGRAISESIGFGAPAWLKIPPNLVAALKGPSALKKSTAGPAIEITEDVSSTPITAPGKGAGRNPGEVDRLKNELAVRKDEMTALKKKLAEVEGDRVILKAKVLKADGEAKKSAKLIQELLETIKTGGTGQITMLAGRLQHELAANKALSARVRELEEIAEQREAKINAMRVIELQEEAKTYYNEVRRLQRQLADAQAGGAATVAIRRELDAARAEIEDLNARIRDFEENGALGGGTDPAAREAARKAREEERARRKEEKEFRKAARSAILRIQHAWRKKLERNRAKSLADRRRGGRSGGEEAVEMQGRPYAAAVIQAFWRAAKARKRARELYEEALRGREAAMVARAPGAVGKAIALDEEDDEQFNEAMMRGEESAPAPPPGGPGGDPHAAATAIQRVYRGHRARSSGRGARARAPLAGLTPEQVGQHNAAEVLLAAFRRRLASVEVQKLRADLAGRRAAAAGMGRREAAARDIQRWWRRHLLRRRAAGHVRSRKMEERTGRRRESEREAREHAAGAIQRAWRSRSTRKRAALEAVRWKRAKQLAIEEERLALSASLITRVVRGWRARVAVRRLRERVAADRAQRIAREEELESLPEVEEDAGPAAGARDDAFRLFY
eukprot:tig00021489_g21656.t1